MFDGLKARLRDYVDPRCADVDCGGPLATDTLRLPVRLSAGAAFAVGRRNVEFHGDCANARGLLLPLDEGPWRLDQNAVDRALGLFETRQPDGETWRDGWSR